MISRLVGSMDISVANATYKEDIDMAEFKSGTFEHPDTKTLRQE